MKHESTTQRAKLVRPVAVKEQHSSSVMARRCIGPEETEAVIALFEAIAHDEGWQPEGELRAHIHRSIYFGLWIGNELVGGLQVVRPDDTGSLPCHQVWAELPHVEDNDRVAHIAVLAVAKPWRGRRDRPAGTDGMYSEVQGSPFWLLVIELWRWCVAQGIRELWLEATPTMLRCYRLLGWPLVVRGPLRVHWGERCFPCYLSPCEVAGTLARKSVTSSTYRTLLLCAVRPADPVEYPAPPH